MKKKYKSILFALGIPFLLFIFFIKFGLKDTEKDSDYYKAIGLELNGTVQEVKPLNYGHGYGVISILITDSNIQKYDKRDELERYFGVIKNGQGALVFNSINSVKVGDSISIKIETYKLFRNGKLIDENFIGMPPPNFIFTPFKEISSKIKL